MKIKALVRIIIWTLISVMLASIFALALAGQLNNFTRRLGVITYDDSGYTAGNGVVTDYGTVTGIDIEWVAGTVSVSSSIEDEISISESAAKEISDWQLMRYKVQDGILYIKYTAPKSYEIWKTVPSKQLKLGLPASLLKNIANVKISAVSAKVELQSLKAEKLEVDSVSGKLTLSNCLADQMKLRSMSGNITLDLPTNDGFVLSYRSVSGNLSTKLDLVSVSEDQYRYKNGAANITVENEMGTLEIKE